MSETVVSKADLKAERKAERRARRNSSPDVKVNEPAIEVVTVDTQAADNKTAPTEEVKTVSQALELPKKLLDCVVQIVSKVIRSDGSTNSNSANPKNMITAVVNAVNYVEKNGQRYEGSVRKQIVMAAIDLALKEVLGDILDENLRKSLIDAADVALEGFVATLPHAFKCCR